MNPIRQRTRETLDRLRQELLAERTRDGHWVGELSASALSTATAVSALAAVAIANDATNSDSCDADLIASGMRYLAKEQNSDGGFGDTDLSHSNIATSYLVLAASTLAGQAGCRKLGDDLTRSLEQYIQRSGGIAGLRTRYGRDKTFVIPILTNLAIAGLVSWDDVAALPFEAAVFPQSMYRVLQMPVVSYAIPALVAIGQARHFHGKPALPPIRWIRSAAVAPAMNVLIRMQPESGGYLEATPLTSFVVMSLAVTGRSEHSVTQNGLRFLRGSMRPSTGNANDGGSWPIDTNLATWVTSLAVHSLACDPDDDASWCSESLVRWQLACQHQQRHPFTGAEPGGWGWTDLSGAVPDSDDTPAAMLALQYQRQWVSPTLQSQIDAALLAGARWLRRLQNFNGGWPTFCRGWGKLPFDRSSTDLTAHAMRAFGYRHGRAVTGLSKRSVRRAIRFLYRQQQPDGSWLPLWFGNQDRTDEANPIYGTARVLISGCVDAQATQRGCDYLLNQQNRDGGWGGGSSAKQKLRELPPERSVRCPDNLISSVEETALAVDALVTVMLSTRNLWTHSGVRNVPIDDDCGNVFGKQSGDLAMSGESADDGENEIVLAAIIRGVDFLLQSVDDRRHRVAWPIGFYFAKLWYHEHLYPTIFTIAALGKFLRSTDEHDPP